VYRRGLVMSSRAIALLVGVWSLALMATGGRRAVVRGRRLAVVAAGAPVLLVALSGRVALPAEAAAPIVPTLGALALVPATAAVSTADLAPLDEEDSAPAPVRVAELPSLRSVHASHYLMSDGSVEVVTSLDPLNYQLEDGSWEPIDTSVLPAEGTASGFVNETNGFSTAFPAESGSEPLAQIATDAGTVEIDPVDGEAGPGPTAQVDGSQVIFPDVFGSADVAYTVLPTGVKEDIVLPGPAQVQPSYQFDLTVGDLSARWLPDGAIGLFAADSTGSSYTSPGLVFVLPAPVLADAADEVSHAVAAEFTQDGPVVSLTLTPEPGWLEAPERAYPVRIDPTVLVAPAPGDAQDTFINKVTPTTNYGTSWNANAGLKSSTEAMRALFRFDIAGLGLPTNTQLTSATLRLHYTQAFKSPTSPIVLAAHRMTADWAENTATWNSSNAAFYPTAGSTLTTQSERDTWHEFSVKTMAQGWVNGTVANYGVMVKAADESSTAPQGGPSYETSEDLFGDTSTSTSGSPTGVGAQRPQLVLTYGANAVSQLVPLVVHEHGAELRWTAYTETDTGSEPGAEADDLVEYQVWRQCVTVSGGTCTHPAGVTFNDQTAELVGTVGADAPALAFTDTTAAESTVNADTTYQYWVVAKLRGDDKASTDGSATPVLSPSNLQRVLMPRSGREIHVILATEDTTISEGQKAAIIPEPDGFRRILVGNNHPLYTVTRGLLSFNTAGLNAEHPVMSARVQLWKTETSGTGSALFEMRRLTRPFVETGASWNGPSGAATWTPGGEYASTPLQPGTVLDGQPGWVTWPSATADSQAFATVVDQWIHTSEQTQANQNNGLLFKAAGELGTNPQQRIAFASAESSDPAFAPRLIVEQLSVASQDTYYAPWLPERFIPSNQGAETVVPVTVTNTTKADTFPANWALSYRWCVPGSPCSATTDTNPAVGNETSNGVANSAVLPRALEPGESATVQLPIKAPINSDNGVKRLEYDLAIELQKPDGHWLSEQPPLTGGGLSLSPLVGADVLVESNTSTELGLEKWQTYATEATGAGSAVFANLRNGNTVWSWNPIRTASAGPATFVRVTNNGQNSVVPPVGRGWSIQPGTLTQLNQPLVGIGGQAPTVTLIDGDGTSHTWKNQQTSIQGTRTLWVYDRPAGVPLDLTKQVSDTAGTIPDEQAWVLTRHDGLRFYFDSTGYQTSVVDTHDNRLVYNYSPGPNRQLSSVYDTARAATTLSLTYTGTHLATIVEESTTPGTSGRTLTFGYKVTDQLGSITDTPASGPGIDSSAQPRTFSFDYNATSDNNGTRLNRITDPRGHATNLTFAADGRVTGWTDRTGGDTTVGLPTTIEGTREVRVDVTDANPVGSGPETTRYTIDGFGRTVLLQDAESLADATDVTAVSWDRDHNVVRLTEPNGAVSAWEYNDDTGYLTRVRTPEDIKNDRPGTTLGYATLASIPGRPTVLTTKTTQGVDPTSALDDEVWTFRYDEGCDGGPVTAYADLTSVVSPRAGHTTHYCYGDRGVLTKVTDPTGGVTTFSNFHATGAPRTVTVQAPGTDLVSTFGYDGQGHATTVTDPAGSLTTVDYDGYGRPRHTTAPGAAADPTDPSAQPTPRTSVTVWDANDNVTSTIAPNNQTTTTLLNDSDLPTTATLPNAPNGASRVISYGYDTVGRLLTQTQPKATETANPNDYLTRVTYDRIGQVKTQIANFVDAGGVLQQLTTAIDYDAVGNVKSVKNPRGYSSSYGYNLNHQKTSVTDAAGYVTRTVYDAEGRVKQSVDAEGNATSYTYYPDGLTQTVTVPYANGVPSRTTSYQYDGNGNPTTTTLPSGYVATTKYDEAGRVEYTEQPHTLNATTVTRTHLAYEDGTGRLAAQSDPTWSGVTGDDVDWNSFSYYPSGEIKSTTDPWGLTTRYGYNTLGQQTVRQFASASGATTRTMRWQFNDDGSLAWKADQSPDAALVEALFDNDDWGNVQATGTWATTTPIKTLPTAGRIGKDYRTHDLVSSWSAPEADDRFSWRLDVPTTGDYRVEVSCIQGAGTATSARYEIVHNGTTDTSDGVNQSTCAGGQAWIPLNGGALFRFNADDTTATGRNEIKLKPGTGGIVAADAVRITKAGDGTSTTRKFSYGYDTNGNMTSLTRGSGPTGTEPTPSDTLSVGYDTLNRASTVTSSWTGAQVTTAYTYDANSNVDTIWADHTGNTDPTRNTADLFTDSFYDLRDLPRIVKTGNTNGTTTKTTSYTYTGRGLLASVTKNNGNLATYSYFRDGSLKVSKETDGTAVVSKHVLTYDAAGQRATDTTTTRKGTGSTGDLAQTATYTYNPGGQLTDVAKTGANAGWDEHYSYDAAGNTLTADVLHNTSTNMYKHNRLIRSTTTPLGGTATTLDYGYDAWGRQVTTRAHTSGDLRARTTWDGFDLITKSVTYNTDGTAANTKNIWYDGLDRVKQQNTKLGPQPWETTAFTYVGLTDQVLAEETKEASVWKLTATYTYGAGGQRLSMTRPQETSADLKESYYTTNPHADVEAVTDKDGDTTSTYRYTAYGQTEQGGTTGIDKDTAQDDSTTDAHNPWRYSSKRWDQATHTYDMGFRDYSPALNQFLSRDMYNGALADFALGSDPWNSNRYGFSGANPIGHIELDGHVNRMESGHGCDDGCQETVDAILRSHTGSSDAINQAVSATGTALHNGLGGALAGGGHALDFMARALGAGAGPVDPMNPGREPHLFGDAGEGLSNLIGSDPNGPGYGTGEFVGESVGAGGFAKFLSRLRHVEEAVVAAEAGGFDLAAAEEAGGHTVARHVGMGDQALIDRNIPYASTFTDQAAAEGVTAQNLSANVGAINKWLAGSSPRLAIQDSMDSALGRVYERATQTFVQPSGVNTVLVRTPTGYNVLTSYPTP
jgi:RHS repeat-associated protein